MNNIPQIGQLAPNFSTPDQNNHLVNLADINQWIVLYFYPKDNTPGCTTEAQDFTELSSQFTAAGAKIIGVSPDSAASHCKFIDKHNLSIALLTDPEHQLIEA
ncbi:MAG: peroxiredoxin, partial [Dolichospermum sp.]